MIQKLEVDNSLPTVVSVDKPYIDLANRTLAMPTSRGIIDTIVVPASRSTTSIISAAQLASHAGAVLIVLCSRSALADDMAQVLSSFKKLSWYAVDIPADYCHPLLTQTAMDVIPVDIRTGSDTSKKRNIGLILGKGIGNNLLFLDDDIELQEAGLRTGAYMLGHYSMVGFSIHPDSFPDNSVGMHATRKLSRLGLLGDPNDTLPSGQYYLNAGSLAVNLSRLPSHFPENIYDEDWLFLYEPTLQRQTAIVSETWKQAAYDPFIDTKRAAREEFFNFNRSPAAREVSSKELSAVNDCLRAAIEVNRTINSRLCIDYYHAWHEVDLPVWSKNYAQLPSSFGIEHMLMLLNLTPYVRSYVKFKSAY